MGLFDKKKNNTEKQEKQTEKTNQKSYQPLYGAYHIGNRHSETPNLRYIPS